MQYLHRKSFHFSVGDTQELTFSYVFLGCLGVRVFPRPEFSGSTTADVAPKLVHCEISGEFPMLISKTRSVKLVWTHIYLQLLVVVFGVVV